MSLLKMHFLPLIGLLFLVSTAFQGIYGLNCYSCSSLEDCAKQKQTITCKESEINCVTKLDETDAIISMSCAETCNANANCCNSELCNTFVALDAIDSTATSEATTTDSTTKSSDETSKEASSDTTSSTDKGSSDTTKSDSESTPTTVPTPATTTESHSNSGTTLTKTLFGIALGIIFSLLTIF